MQTQPNDVDNTFTPGLNKRIVTVAKRPLTWYDADKHAFIPIEPDIIDKLKLTRDDLFTQEIEGNNIILRRFKDDI